MKKIQDKSYQDISLDKLVTYCVFILQEQKREATFEDIVVKCFELFPERFSLVGYPQYPDSARINKSWLRCRTDFKYIQGSVKRGFFVTPLGLAAIEQVQEALNRPISEKTIVAKQQTRERTREEVFINELKRSEVFKRYQKENLNTVISHYEFCDMLYCTLESSAQNLRENMQRLKNYAQKYNNKEILDFLLFAERKYYYLLYEKENEKMDFVGGMNKRKTSKERR